MRDEIDAASVASPDASSTGTGLRGKVVDGAFHLALRQGLGTLISLAGLLLLTRTIGPTAYGTYAAFAGVFVFTTNVGRMGVDVYLIRKKGDAQLDLHQAFTFLALMGAVVAVGGWLGLPGIGQWLGLEGSRSLGLAFLVMLPLNLVTLVPKAQLERRIAYRTVAWIELSTQLIFYLAALPFAFAGWGVTAPIIGWLSAQLLTSILTFWRARYRPVFHWEPERLRSMLSYGFGYSSSLWIWQLRELVNPLVVGRFLGLEAVGHVALAMRLVNTLGFVKAATYRLSISSFAQIQHDLPKLRRVLGEGTRIQVLVLGPALLAFLAVAPWVLPRLFGQEWTPLISVFPFIALGALANATFSLHSSVLYVLQRNLQVAVFHLVHVGLFAGTAFLLVPRIGVAGYGLAEVAALVSYALVHLFTARSVGRLDDLAPLIWTFAFAVALFYPLLGGAALLALVPVALWPESWRTLRGYALDLRRFVHG